MQLSSIASTSVHPHSRLPEAARHSPIVLRSPLLVTPRGGLSALGGSNSRRNLLLVVLRVGSDPGVPSAGSRYNPTPAAGGGGGGGASGSGGGSSSGGGGSSGGRGGEALCILSFRCVRFDPPTPRRHSRADPSSSVAFLFPPPSLPPTFPAPSPPTILPQQTGQGNQGPGRGGPWWNDPTYWIGLLLGVGLAYPLINRFILNKTTDKDKVMMRMMKGEEGGGGRRETLLAESVIASNITDNCASVVHSQVQHCVCSSTLCGVVPDA